MKFTPKTEKQIQEENLRPAGTYSFEIVKAEDKISSKQNEMIELTLKVFDNDGNSFLVNDYLLESMAFKLRHAADACGLIDRYEMGTLQAIDFDGKTGQVKIKISKDKNGVYADKNTVGDYITEKNVVTNSVSASPPMIDDTIPF